MERIINKWWMAIQDEDTGKFFVNEYVQTVYGNLTNGYFTAETNPQLSRDTIFDDLTQETAEKLVAALTEAYAEQEAAQ